MRKPFGEWTPDLDGLLAQNNLQVAKNVFPKVGGYAPIPGLATINSAVLPFAPVGAFRGKRDDGTNQFFAGLNDGSGGFKIYEFQIASDTWVDVSAAAGYAGIGQRRCEFTQFGASIFCASLINETQAIDKDSETVFSRVSSLCPRAAHVATAENFLFLGDIYTRDVGAIRNGIQWSGIDDPYNFPQPGTDASTAVLAGRQVFEGNGGPINAIVPGSEVIAIFQEEAIWRGDFIGGDAVWRFSNVEENQGLLIKGAAQAFERRVFFISEDGFRVFDYTASRNVGKGRVNDWFFANYDMDYPDSVSITRDPGSTRIAVSFAAIGNSGVPNRLLFYDWELDRFSYANTTVYSMIGAGTTPASLDSPDIPGDQDTLQGNTGGGFDDDYDIKSFDDRETGTTSRKLGGFNASFGLATFSGANLAGVLETGDIELEPGRRALLTGVRSHVRAQAPTVQVAGVQDDTLDEPLPLDFTVPEPRDPRSGIHPILLDARYHRVRFNLGTNWTDASFWDPEFSPSGMY